MWRLLARKHRDCPNCGLTNPPTAHRRDRGYDFQTQPMKVSFLPEAERRKPDSGKPAIVLAAIALAAKLLNLFRLSWEWYVPLLGSAVSPILGLAYSGRLRRLVGLGEEARRN